MTRALRGCVALWPAGLACLAAIACSSGGGPGSNSGAAGAAGQGQGGATGGSSGGTTSTAGASGTQGTAGVAGSAGGATGGSIAGAAGGNVGSAGTGATAGSVGAGGRGGAAGSAGAGAAGRGGAGGTAGGAGSSGRGGNVGTGGAAGTGGSSPDGGVPNPVTPTVNGSRYRFAWGDVVLEIDASVGARVATLSLGGADLIVPSTMAARDAGMPDPTTWGSVFWTSPRSAWTPVTWPPPPNIDNAAYQASIAGTHVTATGMTDTSIGVAMAKDYAVDATSGWITINYTIKATKAQKAAPWEVSRVPRGGLVLFPVPMASSVTNQVPLTITQTGTSPRIVWFDDAAMTATSPNGDKLYADGSGGWTAYVRGGNLFLKKYTDQPASAQAPMEGEVDVYPGNGFLEFEVEGPYTMIAASGTLPWSIQWKVVKVPSSVSIAAGSTALVDFVMQQLAQ